MTSKRRLAQLQNARLASVAHFKKRKLERTHHPNTEQPRIDDNELSTTDDTGDTDDTDADTDEEGTWFWNQSANELESDSECDGYSDEEGDLGPEGSRTEEEAPPQKRPKEIKWNKEGEENLRGVYGQGSVATLYRKKKAMKKWEEEGHKSYNIQALWQRNRDLGLISDTSSQHGPGESSGLGDDIDSSHPLSEVPPGRNLSRSKQELNQEQRIIALKDITRLLEFVTVQKEKYKERLSPHSNFYRRHMMVQHFLQIQLKTKPGPTRLDLSMSIARSFGKGQGMARNIVRWKKSWVKKREIPSRKNQNDYFSWMDDEDLQESIRDFARRQGDIKCLKMRNTMNTLLINKI